jgi:hypothetical protein
MQLDGEKRVVEAHRKWLADLQEEQRVTAVIKEDDEQIAELLKVGQELSDFSDGDSDASFIDPTDLVCSQNQSGSDGGRSTSPERERESGSDSDEFVISGVTTPDVLYDRILGRPQAQVKLIGDRATDLAAKIHKAIGALAPSAAAVVAVPRTVHPRSLASADQGDLRMICHQQRQKPRSSELSLRRRSDNSMS